MKIGIIADIHEDIESLVKVLKELNKNNCDKIICLGDIVGFDAAYYFFSDTRDANKCVELISKNCLFTIAGNHDLGTIKKLPEFFRTIRFPENWYDLSLETRKKISNEQVWLYDNDSDVELNKKNIQYLQSLPEMVAHNLDGVNYLFTHFIYPDVTGSTKYYPVKWADFKKHFQFMEKHNCLIGFAGHAHIEGAWIATKQKFETLKFGSYTFKSEPHIIAIPSISKGMQRQGYVIWDTGKRSIEVVAL